jgi:hypothetical protein
MAPASCLEYPPGRSHSLVNRGKSLECFRLGSKFDCGSHTLVNTSSSGLSTRARRFGRAFPISFPSNLSIEDGSRIFLWRPG